MAALLVRMLLNVETCCEEIVDQIEGEEIQDLVIVITGSQLLLGRGRNVSGSLLVAVIE